MSRGKAAQLMATKGLRLRWLALWMLWAKELLACAGLTGDEDVGIGRGVFLGRIDDAPDGIRFADDVGELVAALCSLT